MELSWIPFTNNSRAIKSIVKRILEREWLAAKTDNHLYLFAFAHHLQQKPDPARLMKLNLQWKPLEQQLHCASVASWKLENNNTCASCNDDFAAAFALLDESYAFSYSQLEWFFWNALKDVGVAISIVKYAVYQPVSSVIVNVQFSCWRGLRHGKLL